MPLNDVPQFMRELRSRDAVAARCLEFAVLTSVRTGEALGARWEEIDLERAVWVLPAQRMRKSGRESVSGILCHIGCRTPNTSFVAI